MKKILTIMVSLTALTAASSLATTTMPVYLDDTQPLEARVEDALSRMTLEEKVGMLHGQSTFTSAGVPRLGIPHLKMTDGPHGVQREITWLEYDFADHTDDSCTAFPDLVLLASTWDPSMAALYGRSIGEEARYRDMDLLLGPGANICRTPLNGRSFEYMGEDPYLTSRMIVPYIQGVQSNGVGTCVKHYALNNQEHERTNTNVSVDDRALNEIYLPAFKAAVQDGHSWALMASYNLYDGQHVSENGRLLNDILKGQWGWDGAVVSDWGAVASTEKAALNGMDIEMGTAGGNRVDADGLTVYDHYYMAQPYLKMLREGRADTAVLNDKVRRALRLNMRTAMQTRKPWGSFATPEHFEACRNIAANGIVLLKNDKNLLPLPEDAKILVVGDNAVRLVVGRGGSSALKTQHEVSPYQGIAAVDPNVTFARGYVADTTVRLNAVAAPGLLQDFRPASELVAEAAKMAHEADYVVFVGGLNKGYHHDSEAFDRLGYELPAGQDSLIEALVKANPRTVVVNISGNAVAMPWASKVPAILHMGHGGSETGNALADVLFGRVNPSGHLPMTWGRRLEDYGAHAYGEKTYPGIARNDGSALWDEDYTEGLLVGYRWYDTKKIKPLWAFGHGLSYTTFSYGTPVLSAKEMASDGQLTLTVPVTNTGAREGAEVVQLYITEQAPVVLRPAKELKGFEKVVLQPGETREVTFTITPEALQYYDARNGQWTARPGRFTAHVAAASDDIRASVPFTLK